MDVTPGAPPTALPGQQVTIGIGTQVAGQYLTDANGFVSGNITQLLQNVGQVPAFGNFAGTNHYAATTGTAPFTVYADPNVGGVNGPLYTGSQFFWTTSPSSSTATLALSATLQDTGGACHGNISTATVTFAIRLPGSTVYTPIPSAQNLPVGLVNPNDTTIGTATAIAQYNIGNNPGPVNVDIAIIVGGNYILNNPTTDSTITIAKPGAASAVTGSVWLNLASFGGYYASNGYLANNQPGALELNADVHYNKSGTNPQGSVNMTFTSYNNPDGSPASVPHTYYVKSTSVAELTFASLTQVSFSAKANVRDVSTGASVDSASTLQVTVTKDPNGVNPDMVSVSVQRKSGGLLISSCWDGAKTWQKPVDGPGRMSVTQ